MEGRENDWRPLFPLVDDPEVATVPLGSSQESWWAYHLLRVDEFLLPEQRSQELVGLEVNQIRCRHLLSKNPKNPQWPKPSSARASP